MGILIASLAAGGIKYTTAKIVLCLIVPLITSACSTSIEYSTATEEQTYKGGLFATYVNLKILGQELTWVNERVPRGTPTTRPSH
jgi:hypothetical protein